MHEYAQNVVVVSGALHTQTVDRLVDLASELLRLPSFETFYSKFKNKLTCLIIVHFTSNGVVALATSVPVEVVLTEESWVHG